MSTPIARHEIFNYTNPPFTFDMLLSNMTGPYVYDPHWHEELEIVYNLRGDYWHFINGRYYTAAPGRLVTVNSEFVHNVVASPNLKERSEAVRFLIVISREFLDDNFPQYRELYFTNTKEQASEETAHCIRKIMSFYSRTDHTEYDFLFAKSLVLELLYVP